LARTTSPSTSRPVRSPAPPATPLPSAPPRTAQVSLTSLHSAPAARCGRRAPPLLQGAPSRPIPVRTSSGPQGRTARSRLAGGLHRHPAQSGAQDRPLRAPLLGRTASPGPRPGPHRDRCRHPRRGHQLVPSRHPRSQLLRRDADRHPAVSDDRPATTRVPLHPSMTPERPKTPRKTPGRARGRPAPGAPPDDPYERAPRHLTTQLATGSPLLQESPRDARASPCRHCHLQDPTRQLEGCQSTLIALAGG